MKLLAVVQTFGGHAMVQLGYGREGVFFAGKQPAVPSMITLELPGLKRVGIAIQHWLIAYHRKGKKTRRQRVELVEKLWRPTVLDDFIDAQNATTYVWYVAQYFPAKDIAVFAEKHGPKLLASVREALAVERIRRPRALVPAVAKSSRILPVIGQGTYRLQTEMELLRQELDREDAAILVTSPFSVAKWIRGIKQLRTDIVKAQVLTDMGKQLAERPALIAGALDALIAAKLDQVHAPELWGRIANHIPLDSVTGKTLDLTTASEITAELGWPLWQAKRVGPVKPGRSVLAVVVGKQTYYVRGERKLKHRIRERGGTIKRWGCKLVVGGDAGTGKVHAKLLEVERIDTLAQIDPRKAVALLGDRHDAAIVSALHNATDDPRWRRILADLLIERLVGIDADVARRLSRAQAGANRR